MTTIILSRHGKPAWDYRTPIPGRAFAGWRRGEDNAPLDPSSRPSTEVAQLVRTASCVVTSPLRRSLESAHLLAPSSVPVTDALFREAELPCGFRSGAQLRPDVWVVLARSAWFCGWSDGMESFAAARERASQAARLLTARAEAHDAIAVVGHGMMNIFIARALRARGWRGPRIPSPGHWSFGVYTDGRSA
ncbi:MAG TPA: histidine phosphatase family protein [Gemmatimonadales bacterium]|nr:histidine phosphatase family protein [Gemmatimonadales bacterium]